MAREVKFGDWISKGFDLYKQNFGVLLLASAIATILSAATAGILAGPMMAGMILITLRLLRGQSPKPSVSALFDGFSHFLQMFLFCLVWFVIIFGASFVINLIPCIGQIASIAGALALGALLMFAPYLIVDRGLGFWPASTTSMDAVKAAFWPLLGFSVVTQILGQIGAIACVVGIVFTLPIMVCAMSVAYLDFLADGATGTPDAGNTPQPEAPPPLA